MFLTSWQLCIVSQRYLLKLASYPASLGPSRSKVLPHIPVWAAHCEANWSISFECDRQFFTTCNFKTEINNFSTFPPPSISLWYYRWRCCWEPWSCKGRIKRPPPDKTHRAGRGDKLWHTVNARSFILVFTSLFIFFASSITWVIFFLCSVLSFHLQPEKNKTILPPVLSGQWQMCFLCGGL